jgi:hypothetical protein
MIREYLQGYVDSMNRLAEIYRPLNLETRFSAPVAVHQFVLKHGEVWRGRALPKRYRLRPVKRCFMNTYNLVKRSKVLTYAEGYVISAKLPLAVHHAWAIDQHSQVIDPTLRSYGDLRASGGGEGHYMGVKFPAWFVREWWDCSMLDGDHGPRLDVIEAYQQLMEALAA